MAARFALLSGEQIEAIHQASLAILAEVGVVLRHPVGQSLLLDHGGRLQGGRLVLSPEMIQASLRTCPHSVRLRGREGEVVLGDGDLHPHNLGGARAVLDTPDGEPRPATADDVARSARLLDALPEVHSLTPLYTPTDVPSPLLAAASFERTLQHTRKPIQSPGLQTAEEAALIAEITRVVLGEGPVVVAAVSPVSPLSFPDDAVAAILEVCRQGLAFAPLPCPILGATAPLTIAGALAQQNAEVLAGIVLAQLAAPGIPCVYHGRISAMNMRTGDSVWGCPEVGLASAATVQLAHRYSLPVNVVGLSTSVYPPDLQNGAERTQNALLAALAGADEISGVGEIAGGVVSGPAQIVADNEILRSVRRIVCGVAVSPETVAGDVVARVMDGDRNFLAERHTLDHLQRGEAWLPELSVQEARWEAWREAGGPTLIQRAAAEAERLMAEHEVPPLPDHQAREVAAILASVELRA